MHDTSWECDSDLANYMFICQAMVWDQSGYRAGVRHEVSQWSWMHISPEQRSGENNHVVDDAVSM